MNEFKERIIKSIRPLILYSIFINPTKIIEIICQKFDYALPKIEKCVEKHILFLILDFSSFKLKLSLHYEIKENGSLRIVKIT